MCSSGHRTHLCGPESPLEIQKYYTRRLAISVSGRDKDLFVVIVTLLDRHAAPTVLDGFTPPLTVETLFVDIIDNMSWTIAYHRNNGRKPRMNELSPGDDVAREV
ncbi:hypothetical protein QTP88_006946 [Uroleucon formosanum]